MPSICVLCIQGWIIHVLHVALQVLQQMRSDVALLTKEEGGSPIRNPSTASEDARIASLMSLEDIVKQAEVSEINMLIMIRAENYEM